MSSTQTPRQLIERLQVDASERARVRARAMDRAIGRIAAKYPRTVKSRVWDIMAIDFVQRPELFADDLFHASAEGHLAFATIGAPMVDRLVEVLEEERNQGSE